MLLEQGNAIIQNYITKQCQMNSFRSENGASDVRC